MGAHSLSRDHLSLSALMRKRSAELYVGTRISTFIFLKQQSMGTQPHDATAFSHRAEQCMGGTREKTTIEA